MSDDSGISVAKTFFGMAISRKDLGVFLSEKPSEDISVRLKKERNCGVQSPIRKGD